MVVVVFRGEFLTSAWVDDRSIRVVFKFIMVPPGVMCSPRKKITFTSRVLTWIQTKVRELIYLDNVLGIMI
jgi:hypothetical protein